MAKIAPPKPARTETPLPADQPSLLTPSADRAVTLAVAGFGILLALLTVGTLFVESMAASHYSIVPIGTVFIVLAWLLEPTRLRLPRPIFTLFVVGPNVWFAAIGHTGVNLLFLLLVIPWVTSTGARRDGIAAVAIALATVAMAAAVDAADGNIMVSAWLSWSIGIVVVWLMSEIAVSQRRLANELRAAQDRLAAEAQTTERLRAEAEERARETEALYQVSERLHRSLRVDDVLQALVDVAGEVLRVDKSAVHIWDPARDRLVTRASRGMTSATRLHESYAPGEGIAGTVFTTGRIVTVEDVPADPRVARPFVDLEGIRSVISTPIVIGGQVYGVFGANYSTPRTFTADDERLFTALAQHAAVAIENAQLYEQAQHGAVLEERARLARELHDSVTQSIYSVVLLAEAGRRLAKASDTERAAEHLGRLGETAQQALKEMRLLVYELRPVALAQEGLVGAIRRRLEAVEQRAGLKARVVADDGLDLPPAVEQGLFGIAQEALNNTLKHAHASTVTVRLARTGDAVTLEVEDDGRGFDRAALDDRGGLGLTSMAERAERLAATLAVDASPGAGTTVNVVVPLAGQR